MNLQEEIKKRRTFAIISHPDAGKTTITEQLLYFGGEIREAGTVKGKKTGTFAKSDWMDIEKQRGISVTSSVMQFDYDGKRVNILDTPGHEDFSEDTYRTLMAVDAAVMVVDSAKGIEAQTKKLFEVVKHRGIPVFTFMNKLDRDGREPLDLLQELEEVLGIASYPMNWPIGMGKAFEGLYDLYNQRLELYKGDDRFASLEDGDKLFGSNPFYEQVKEDIELLNEAGNEFSEEAILSGELTPVFFGSALTNFGVQTFLETFLKFAPEPHGHKKTDGEIVDPYDKDFSGFVFKIQANMDPKHRDRIAFLRVCSGKFERGMKMKHLRINREIAASSVVTFMSHDRELVEEAYAGDIIGIPNHGNIQIGDSFSEGEQLAFTGIPFFAPELFRSVRIKNPLKIKQLQKGLQQLGEEGAVQVFKPMSGADLILGAVGVLQFEVVTSRLANEYGVEAVFDSASIWSARWVSCEDKKKLAEFEKANASNLAIDAGGNLAYLAPNRVNLGLTQERWPDIVFHETREHSVKL